MNKLMDIFYQLDGLPKLSSFFVLALLRLFMLPIYLADAGDIVEWLPWLFLALVSLMSSLFPSEVCVCDFPYLHDRIPPREDYPQ